MVTSVISQECVPSSDSQISHASLDKHTLRNNIIKDVALKSFSEFVMTSVMVGITCIFVATPAIPSLVIYNVSILAFSIILRAAGGAVLYKSHVELAERKINEAEAKILRLFEKSTKFFCPALFSSLCCTTSHVVVHESGHALAIYSLFANSKPVITIKPFEYGFTSFIPGTLSSLGAKIGLKWSMLIVTAAGSIAGVVTSTVIYAIGRAILSRAPELARYMEAYGISGIAIHAAYPISDLFSSGGGDFYKIWKTTGIHPLVSFIGVVALPIIVISGMELYYQLAGKKNVA